MGLATKFWAKNPEVAEHNQYWYSEKTIAAIVDEVRGGGAGSQKKAFHCIRALLTVRVVGSQNRSVSWLGAFRTRRSRFDTRGCITSSGLTHGVSRRL